MEASSTEPQTDPLTGLYRRNYWLGMAEGLLAQSKEAGSVLGFIHADIDGMKPFNDINGLQSGDRLLVALAELMQSLLPERAIASRYGGDEFLIAMPAMTEAEVYEVAEAIRQQAKTVVVLGGYYDGKDWDAAPVTLTLGLSFSSRQEGDLRSLIVAADEATLRGKEAKGDCVVYPIRCRNQHSLRPNNALQPTPPLPYPLRTREAVRAVLRLSLAVRPLDRGA